jgi:hypothetical protein
MAAAAAAAATGLVYLFSRSTNLFVEKESKDCPIN